MVKIIRFCGILIFFFIVVSSLNYKGYTEFSKLDLLNKIFFRPSITDLTYLYTSKTKKRKTVEYIVLHHSAIETIENQFSAINRVHIRDNNWSGISYHFSIDNLGKTFQYHKIENITPHVKAYNSVAVGICIEGDFNKMKISAAQYKSLIKLLKQLKNKFPTAAIVGHNELNKTDCPGTNIKVHDIIFLLTNTNHFLEL